jgi:two-component sensor histidine kinase
MSVMAAESSECVPGDFAARILAAADRERRRLERDLHDGAQQRLVSLSMHLRLVAMRLAPGSEAERLLASAQDELAASLQELRELARGLHPAVLTEHGLPAALESLVTRAPLPVDLRVELARRPSQAVEVAAYYVVSEALTNVAKYADASTVAVRVGRHGTRLVVSVADDGVGGADPAAGSGLRGLADRLAALGGSCKSRALSQAGPHCERSFRCRTTHLTAPVSSTRQRAARAPPRRQHLGRRAHLRVQPAPAVRRRLALALPPPPRRRGREPRHLGGRGSRGRLPSHDRYARPARELTEHRRQRPRHRMNDGAQQAQDAARGRKAALQLTTTRHPPAERPPAALTVTDRRS